MLVKEFVFIKLYFSSILQEYGLKEILKYHLFELASS